MRILNIYATYNCPFKCRFCFNYNKCDDKQLIDINYVDRFLKKNSKKFDKIIINGGEPSLLLKSYMEELISTCKKYKEDVYMSTYMLQNAPHFDVKYIFSYDLVARPRVKDAWINLIGFDKDFDLAITLSPMLFRYPPNKVFQTLAQLPHLKNVYLKPYYKNVNNHYEIKKTDYEKYMSAVRGTQLKLNYSIEYDSFPDEFNLTPYGKLTVTRFDDNEYRYESEVSENDIERKETNYPRSVKV